MVTQIILLIKNNKKTHQSPALISNLIHIKYPYMYSPIQYVAKKNYLLGSLLVPRLTSMMSVFLDRCRGVAPL